MKLKYYLRGVGVGLILAVVIYSTMIIPRKYRMTDEEVISRAEALGMVRGEKADVDLSALSGTPAPTGDGTGLTPQAELTPDAAPDENPDASPTMPEFPSVTPDAGMTPAAAPDENPDANPTMPEFPSVIPDAELTLTAAPDENPDADPTMPGLPSATPDASPTSPDVSPTMPEFPNATPDASPTIPTVPTMPDVPTMPAMPTLPPESVTPEPDSTEDGRIRVTITAGMGSETFAAELQKAGIIEDAADFDRYLMQNNYALSIQPGTYRFLPGTTYEEIAARVTNR